MVLQPGTDPERSSPGDHQGAGVTLQRLSRAIRTFTPDVLLALATCILELYCLMGSARKPPPRLSRVWWGSVSFSRLSSTSRTYVRDTGSVPVVSSSNCRRLIHELAIPLPEPWPRTRRGQ